MWIVIGLLGFYLIYWLEFRFYLVSIIKMGYSRAIVPMFLLNQSSHWIIHGLVILIFCLSTYSFYRANPWAVLLSPALLLLAMIVHAQKTSSRTDKVVRIAVSLQASLEREGKNQAEINEAVCIAALGEREGAGRGWNLSEPFRSRGLDADWVLKEMVKSTILPSLGLLASRGSLIEHNGDGSSAFKQYEKDCQEIDWKMESALKRLREKQAVG